MENSAEREINATIQILETWGVLNDLSKLEKERIKEQLVLIAKNAVKDYKESCNKINLNFNLNN